MRKPPFLKNMTRYVLDYLPSKSTSPISRSFPVFGSWMRFMPTSMTAAPSFTISAVMSPGTPAHRDQGQVNHHRGETMGHHGWTHLYGGPFSVRSEHHVALGFVVIWECFPMAFPAMPSRTTMCQFAIPIPALPRQVESHGPALE